MPEELLEVLLGDVKDYLQISWQDEKTDKNLQGMIKRGVSRLQEIAGVSLDFSVEDLPKSLLLDYCRYANSHALEMFEKNFLSELLSLQINSDIQSLSEETS